MRSRQQPIVDLSKAHTGHPSGMAFSVGVDMKVIPELTAKQARRFWSKVDRSGGPNACWEWQAGRTTAGYGMATVADGVRVLSHRLAFFLSTSIQPRTLCVRHQCDNPACCNPQHLALGTHQQNMDDKVARDRQHKGEQTPWAVLTEVQVKMIRESSETDTVLAERLGLPRTTITSARRGVSWKHLPNARMTPCHRKLTPSQVQDIKTSTDKNCDLAKRFGVSPQTICDIRKGRRHVS